MPRDPETCMPGAIALLAKHTDWREMTRPLNESPNHVSSMQRWEKQARSMNPDLSDEQVARLAQLLKKRHYALMTRRSAEVRRANRDRKAAAAKDGAADETP